MKLGDALVRAWYAGSAWLLLLRPLEALYRRVAARKRYQNLSQAYRAPVPVLVVGNITLGGTGKTPLILWLIEHCRQRGWRVGVVSRGYGGQPPNHPWRVEPGQSPRCCGDEPLMLVERTGVPLYIDPDRPAAVRALLAEHPVDLILSDDGLQHYRLARDLELVMLDARRGLGNGRCLPAGPLREPAERLQSVDAVLCNGQSGDSAEGYGFQLQPEALQDLATGDWLPLGQLPAGRHVHAVAGIGNPERFFHTLSGAGWTPIPHAFADHARYTADQLDFGDELPVVMTEKDAVKCRDFARPGWYALRVIARPSPAFVDWLDRRLEALQAPTARVATTDISH